MPSKAQNMNISQGSGGLFYQSKWISKLASMNRDFRALCHIGSSTPGICHILKFHLEVHTRNYLRLSSKPEVALASY
jgi:hypothetical protein